MKTHLNQRLSYTCEDECPSTEGAWLRVIFNAYSFICDSFECQLWKNLQFVIKRIAIKRISQSKPNLWYTSDDLRQVVNSGLQQAWSVDVAMIANKKMLFVMLMGHAERLEVYLREFITNFNVHLQAVQMF